MGGKRGTLEERFWRKVDVRGPDECWPWTAGTTCGYGVVTVAGGRKIRAHRLSWQIHLGPIPEGEGHHGTCVLHHCDQPSCVNPSHLFLGTQADNMADMFAKGRGRSLRGENHGRAKLTENSVFEIRKRYSDGESQKSIAVAFGVSRPNISYIVTKKRWDPYPERSARCV